METPITLKQILLEEAETAYTVTEKLFHKVSDDELSWKPTTGRNWMTVGQLLMHCASFGCGKALRGFVEGDWGPPEPGGSDNIASSQLPPAEALPSVDSVEQAFKLLAEDKILAMHCIDEVEECDLLSKKMTAPWGGPEVSMFQQLLLMVAHLVQHKGQLFYYLKLMGRDVGTVDLWSA